MNEPREITESFRLERVLRSSRSAFVFQATDPATNRVVAIKLIPPAAREGTATLQDRFLRAIEAVAVLAPPGFPALLDGGFTPDGSAYMVMALVDGVPLDTLADPRPELVLRLLAETAAALEALGARNVGHGNLRPDNLLVTGAGEEGHVVILGFGSAAFQGAAGGGGGAPEDPAYAAPERRDPATAAAEPDWRSDVYSLARTACAVLRAEVAHADTASPTVTLPATVRQRLRDPIVLRAILEQALRGDPEARPASPAEFCQAIELALAGVPGHDSDLPEIVREERPAEPPPAEDAAGERAGEASTPSPAVQTGPVPVARRDEIPPAPPEEGEPFEAEEIPPAVEAEATVPEPAEEGAPPADAGEEGAPGPPPAPRPRRSRRGVAAGAAAGALVLLAAAAILLLQNRRAAPPPRAVATPTRAPRRPTPAPQPSTPPEAVTRLQHAEAAIALGELRAAREALDAITQDQLDALSAAERDRYASLRAAYDAKVAQSLTRALAGGLASGNLNALAETVRGISKEDEAGFARNDDLLAALDEARRALNVQSLMLRAQRQGDWTEVLQQASVLVSLVPRATRAGELRERAASTLERDADALAARGEYAVALARLAAVMRSWPERRGIAARIERTKADQATDAELASLLAAAEHAEAEKAPEKGLAALAAVNPPARWQERVRQVRARLAEQLRQLDAAPPTVALEAGSKLDYKKNEPATITLHITDDHGIKSARLFARAEGSGEYVELPLRPGASGRYAAEISPAFHRNGTVEFYVSVTDFSDHAATLGSAADPLKLKRRRWFLFGG